MSSFLPQLYLATSISTANIFPLNMNEQNSSSIPHKLSYAVDCSTFALITLFFAQLYGDFLWGLVGIC
jgi:hypothetical protein